MRAVLDKVAKVGELGPGDAGRHGAGHRRPPRVQGLRAPAWSRSTARPATVNRKVEDGYTGPRVTKVVFAVDVGLPINPLGLEAQMMGGIMDAHRARR